MFKVWPRGSGGPSGQGKHLKVHLTLHIHLKVYVFTRKGARWDQLRQRGCWVGLAAPGKFWLCQEGLTAPRRLWLSQGGCQEGLTVPGWL